MMKKILVCMKAVPSSVAVPVDSKYHLDRDGVGLEWNPADLSALEAALRLKNGEGEVVVLTMGPSKIEMLLKELFPLGVDRAILLSDGKMAGADTFATARTLKAAASKFGPFDLILCGRRAIDGETGQVAPSLAAAMEIPSVSDVEKIEEKEGEIHLFRRLEIGTDHLLCKECAVVSVCEYSYPLRLPGILSMRKAKGKCVEIVSADDLSAAKEEMGMKGSLTKVLSMTQNFPGKRQCVRITDPQKAMEMIMDQIGEVAQ
jgi:electron transfer flavoprotein beta subunit